MFNIGDEVRIKTTGETGTIINKIEHDNRNDYLVRVDNQEFWYLENILELATISKTETVPKFKIGDDVIVKGNKCCGKVIEIINKKSYLIKFETSRHIYYENELMPFIPISKTTDYSIKSDQDKPQLHLVPIQPIWEAIARVREHGVKKYGDNDSWKKVEIKRYHDALLRHTAAITQDLNAVDEESGLPHRWHIACNLAFIEYLIGADDENK